MAPKKRTLAETAFPKPMYTVRQVAIYLRHLSCQTSNESTSMHLCAAAHEIEQEEILPETIPCESHTEAEMKAHWEAVKEYQKEARKPKTTEAKAARKKEIADDKKKALEKKRKKAAAKAQAKHRLKTKTTWQAIGAKTWGSEREGLRMMRQLENDARNKRRAAARERAAA